MTRPCSNDLRERVARAHLTGGPDPVGGGAWRCERVLSAPISGALPGDRERGAGPDRRPPRVAAGSAARAGAHARGGGFGFAAGSSDARVAVPKGARGGARNSAVNPASAPTSDRFAPNVLHAVGDGRSYRWIARSLGIVADIVKRHRANPWRTISPPTETDPRDAVNVHLRRYFRMPLCPHAAMLPFIVGRT